MRSTHRRTDTRRAALTSAVTAVALGLGVLAAGSAAAAGHQPGGAPTPRTAAAPAAPAAPAEQQISTFTVKFPSAPYRTHNIARAVELINGSVVRPGAIWSFNKTVGERTPENGFVDGIMINDGRYMKAPGGGISAVATTMYNAMFFAGLKPVEHGAHSFYIERYPEGREATVAWGTLDLRWKNDSGHPVRIRAASSDTSVTITLLGTKKYDAIRATKSARTHITPPAKRTATGDTCEEQTPLEGFDVSVDRIFVKDGRELGRETFRTHYTPRDEVTCLPVPSATPTPSATPSATSSTTPSASPSASATPAAQAAPAAGASVSPAPSHS